MDQAEELQKLKRQLLNLGAEEGELDQVIQDVNDVVIQRALQEHFSQINNPDINKTISTLSGQELIEYFKDNASTIPPLSESRLKEIGQATWIDYFEFMNSQ